MHALEITLALIGVTTVVIGLNAAFLANQSLTDLSQRLLQPHMETWINSSSTFQPEWWPAERKEFKSCRVIETWIGTLMVANKASMLSLWNFIQGNVVSLTLALAPLKST